MVSGDKNAWKYVEEIVRAVAPASFYGGYKVEWANTTAVGVLTFITSVRMVCLLALTTSLTTFFVVCCCKLATILN